MEQISLTSDGKKAQVQSVLLLTDGIANCWITSKNGIVAEMKKMQDLGIGAVSVEPVYYRRKRSPPQLFGGHSQKRMKQVPSPPMLQQNLLEPQSVPQLVQLPAPPPIQTKEVNTVTSISSSPPYVFLNNTMLATHLVVDNPKHL